VVSRIPIILIIGPVVHKREMNARGIVARRTTGDLTGAAVPGQRLSGSNCCKQAITLTTPVGIPTLMLTIGSMSVMAILQQPVR
jgi:hypothetical protein